jgi:hypothetical protein
MFFGRDRVNHFHSSYLFVDLNYYNRLVNDDTDGQSVSRGFIYHLSSIHQSIDWDKLGSMDSSVRLNSGA